MSQGAEEAGANCGNLRTGAAHAAMKPPMNRLFLLRHAKAAWAAPGTSDFDRPLDAVGQADTRRMAAELVRMGIGPQKVLCSSATRTAQTWQQMAPAYASAIDTSYDLRLYSADAPQLLEIVQEQDFSGDMMVVGHNPTIEDVAAAFAAKGTEEARRWLESGFPTCGFAIIELDGPFAAIEPGKGRLTFTMGPADIQDPPFQAGPAPHPRERG